ncbi:MAG: preprotein translocase subunit YajC [Acidobacteria bacterium]|nr:preprotein translocase subunit YajC [Acidobacteriota bacterium]MBU4307117.1 preprotein translocase subunit YajC [Acidobacteriota bacterium]MCG2812640.1 preprotein translocase subunit YajC [Candidatus Aminicenantes bacterium]
MQNQNMLVQLIPFVVIFGIFYLLIIMPARKKQKQHQNMISSLKGGERIITAGGVYGTVTRVMDDRFEIQVDGNTKLQITKSSISSVLEVGGEKSR